MRLSSFAARPVPLAAASFSAALQTHYNASPPGTVIAASFMSSLAATPRRFTSTGLPGGQSVGATPQAEGNHPELGLPVTVPPSQVVEANTVPDGFLGPRRAYLRMNRIKAFGEWDCSCGAINCGDRTDCFECGRSIEECAARVHRGGTEPSATPNSVPTHQEPVATATTAATATTPSTSNETASTQCPDDEEYIRREISVPGRGSRGGAWRPSRGGSGTFASRGRGATPTATGGAPATSSTSQPTTPGLKPSATFNPATTKAAVGTASASAATPGAPRVWTPAGNNPGDWKCPCGANNFSYRKTCFKCSKPKPLG